MKSCLYNRLMISAGPQIVKKKVVHVIAGMLLLLITSCEKSFLSEEESRQKQLKHEKEINDFTDHPDNPRVRYPIIERVTFIPRDEHWSFMKTLGWKITWPDNQDLMDEDDIPTMFSTSTGALNSFNYLNAVDSLNTYNAHFSLYHKGRLFSNWCHEYVISKKLNYVHFYSIGEGVKRVYFAKINKPQDEVEDWVKEKPSVLATKFWELDTGYDPGSTEFYGQLDMYMFCIIGHGEYLHQYGVIRIVKTKPRIIEVYLAVPNNSNYSH
jgi:hypothetical protein